jgi:hypothetical protein
MSPVPQSHNFDPDLAALFLQSFGEALRAARLLQVSIRRIFERLRTYAIDHTGLAESDLAEVPL